MTALHPVASRSPERTGVRCPGQGAPSARKIVTVLGFGTPDQPDNGRIATYCARLGPDSWWDDRCATIVGNRENPGSHTSAGSSVTGRQRKEEADDDNR